MNRLSLYRRFFGIVSLLLVLLSSANAAVATDEQQIRDVFIALQKALVAHDGNQALSLISSDTKEYYRMLSSIASSDLTLAKLESQHLTPLNLFMVKHARKTLPKNFWIDYKKNNPDKLLKFAVDKGLSSNELTDGVRLGNINIEGQTASGKLIKVAKVLPVQLGFKKESGQWKVSLLAMFEQANTAAEAFLHKSGMTVQDLEKLVVQ